MSRDRFCPRFRYVGLRYKSTRVGGGTRTLQVDTQHHPQTRVPVGRVELIRSRTFNNNKCMSPRTLCHKLFSTLHHIFSAPHVRCVQQMRLIDIYPALLIYIWSYISYPLANHGIGYLFVTLFYRYCPTLRTHTNLHSYITL